MSSRATMSVMDEGGRISPENISYVCATSAKKWNFKLKLWWALLNKNPTLNTDTLILMLYAANPSELQ